jgi:hypothetical protein
VCAGEERVAQGHPQAFGVDRLDHEVGRPRSHGRGQLVDGVIPGLYDNRNGEAGRAHRRQQADSVEVGHGEVEQERIDACGVGVGERGHHGIAARGNHGFVAELVHHMVEEAALCRIVVDDQNPLAHDASPSGPCVEMGLCRRGGLTVNKDAQR